MKKSKSGSGVPSIHENDEIDEKALKALIRAAVADVAHLASDDRGFRYSATITTSRGAPPIACATRGSPSCPATTPTSCARGR